MREHSPQRPQFRWFGSIKTRTFLGKETIIGDLLRGVPSVWKEVRRVRGSRRGNHPESAKSKTTERQYGALEAERYQRSRHGPDGKVFLDPRIASFLEDSRGQNILDVGTGAATVAIEAVRNHGVHSVSGVDKFPAMVERAKTAVIEAGLSKQIEIRQADAASLPYADESFNRIISVNVGCNLDTATLRGHLQEMARVVTQDGQILFTAPITLGEVFSNGNTDKLWSKLTASISAIELELAKSEGVIPQEKIQKHLGDIHELHRGTFVIRNGHIRLVANNRDELPIEVQGFTIIENELQEGEPIWRKLPGLVVPNNYHSQASYEQLVREAGLEIAERHIDNFATEADRDAYNAQVPDDQPERKLGAEYIRKGPFAVYVLKKAPHTR